jgi:hypothetical protein
MIKTLVHPTTGTIVRLGCNPPPHPPKLLFRDFLGTQTKIPWAPDVFDWSEDAAAALAQMYLNGTTTPGVPVFGDCVPAGEAHRAGVMTGNADGGSPLIFTNEQIEWIYTGMSGGTFNPDDPSTDQGCDPETALTFEMTKGLLVDGSHKIAGFVGVDADNPGLIRAADYLLEGVGLALNLPDAYVDPFPSESGFTWGVAGPPVAANGHWIIGCGATAAGLKIATWAMTGIMSWPAVAKYCMPEAGGMLYAIPSHDALNRGTKKSPTGIEWGKIKAAFVEMGGAPLND